MKSTRRFALMVGLLVLLAGFPGFAHAQGNSGAAHACQNGGYLSLVGSGGETFTNPGQCVSFAAQGGTFATGIVILAGQTVTFSGATLSADHALAYGYATTGGVSGQLGGKPEVRDTVVDPSQTIGPFPTAAILTVYLTDVTCGSVTYYSDGNHARVTASPPVFQVDIADAGLGCSRQDSAVTFSGAGNLSVQVVINP